MKRSGRISLVLTVLAVGTVLWAWGMRASATNHEKQVADLARQRAETTTRRAQLQTQLAVDLARAAAVEKDNKTLADALEKARSAQAVQAAAVTVTSTEVSERIVEAQRQVKTGDSAELLRELLWCYDEGHRRLGAAQATWAIGRLFAALAELGARHPPALAALRQRAEALRQQVLGPGGEDFASELAAAAKALKDDALPPDSKARPNLSNYGGDAFLALKRYGDIYHKSTFQVANAVLEGPRGMKITPRPAIIAGIAGKNLEIMAGAGAVDEARTFLRRVLALDDSEATRAILRQHLERAGRPDLMPSP